MDDDVASEYRAMLARLYPGEAIEAPPSITIGGDGPGLSIDFGIVKGEAGGRWRVPEPFRDLAAPVLLREAYRAGFPPKTARAPSMVHACNWLAWKSIEDKALQKRFFDTWLAASAAERPGATVYTLPPAFIKEMDKVLDVDPRELHELLVRYSAENERLLGKQLRYDAAEQWAYHKAIEHAPVPSPAVMDLLHAFAAAQAATRDVPARQWLIDRALAVPRFAPGYTATQIEDAWAAFTKFACIGRQPDVSMTGHRYVYVYFTPAPRHASADWGSLLRIPGMSLGHSRLQGGPLDGGETGTTHVARYGIPVDALDALFDFFSTLSRAGAFVTHRIYILGDAMYTVNYNCYVPAPEGPALVLAPLRDEQDLFLCTVLRFSCPPGRRARFMAWVAGEGLRAVREFTSKACSPFVLSAARYDSWLAGMAAEARVTPAVARRWLDALVKEHAYLVPDPRCTYLFNAQVGALTRLHVLAKGGNKTGSGRARIAKLFPSTFTSWLRGARVADELACVALVPRGQLERASRLVHEALPGARLAIDMGSPSTQFGYKAMGWLDGTGTSRAAPAIDALAVAARRVVTGEWPLSQYLRDAVQPVEDSFNAL